jgi:hypothetical protein
MVKEDKSEKHGQLRKIREEKNEVTKGSLIFFKKGSHRGSLTVSTGEDPLKDPRPLRRMVLSRPAGLIHKSTVVDLRQRRMVLGSLDYGYEDGRYSVCPFDDVVEPYTSCQFWVKLRACKWQCCGEIHSVSLQWF